MPVPLRILRAQAECHPENRPILSTKELEQRSRILLQAQETFARYSRVDVTFKLIADSVRLSTTLVRRQFACVEDLLVNVIREHLDAVADSMKRIHPRAPDRWARARAAYRAYTQPELGTWTEAHMVLMEQTANLPPDLRQSVEAIRTSIGYSLAGEHGSIALTLLDKPGFPLEQVEAMLATLPNQLGEPYHAPPPEPAATPDPVPPPEPSSTPAFTPPLPAGAKRYFSADGFWTTPSLRGPNGEIMGARAGPDLGSGAE